MKKKRSEIYKSDSWLLFVVVSLERFNLLAGWLAGWMAGCPKSTSVFKPVNQTVLLLFLMRTTFAQMKPYETKLWLCSDCMAGWIGLTGQVKAGCCQPASLVGWYSDDDQAKFVWDLHTQLQHQALCKFKAAGKLLQIPARNFGPKQLILHFLFPKLQFVSLRYFASSLNSQ